MPAVGHPARAAAPPGWRSACPATWSRRSSSSWTSSRGPPTAIDARALPDPVAGIEATAKPADQLERDILAIWAEVLGHDRIGVNQSFFEIGGNSLRVVRLQTELEKLLGRPVASAKLFEHFTIKTLAAYLAGGRKAAPEITAARRRADDEDIAIIGMACRLPGGVTTPEEYWDLLERGADGIIEVPRERWDAAALYDPDPETRGASYCNYGGFVTPVDLFDAAFFGVSPREARALDPMQRMVLETTWQAFERAGYTAEQLRGSQTGAFIGVGKSSAYHEYGVTVSGGLADLDGYVGGAPCPAGVLCVRPRRSDHDRGHRLLLLAGDHTPGLQRAAGR
ncbi:hypothetical protein GXW82_31180 [Streptacidiphilus sp. 4-A2]|nr:hypothetical protein [Streptacidiphilus sp. 4-A2]